MRITESQLRQVIREEITMSVNTMRTFRSIMTQVGTDGRTPIRDVSPGSRFSDKENAIRQGVDAGLLTIGGRGNTTWLEVTDAGYDWLSSNVDPDFGKTF
jgi:hypothetical protein